MFGLVPVMFSIFTFLADKNELGNNSRQIAIPMPAALVAVFSNWGLCSISVSIALTIVFKFQDTFFIKEWCGAITLLCHW